MPRDRRSSDSFRDSLALTLVIVGLIFAFLAVR